MLTLEQREQARQLRRNGMSLRAIADFFGVTHVTILKVVGDIDVPGEVTNRRGRRESVRPTHRGPRPETDHKAIAAAVARRGVPRVAQWALEGADARGAEAALREALGRLRTLGVIDGYQVGRTIEVLGMGGDDGDVGLIGPCP